MVGIPCSTLVKMEYSLVGLSSGPSTKLATNLVDLSTEEKGFSSYNLQSVATFSGMSEVSQWLNPSSPRVQQKR